MSNEYKTIEDFQNLGFHDDYIVSEIVDNFMSEDDRQDFFSFLTDEYSLDEVYDNLDDYYYEASVSPYELLFSLIIYLPTDSVEEYYEYLLEELDQ